MTALIVFLVMLGLLVFVHELGHFMVAKWAGIHVETFSLGFGRKLFGKRIGDTEYRVSALPLGGYVRMAGQSDMPQEVDGEEVVMEEWEKNVPDDQRFTAKSPGVRAAVLFAGPFMNAMFGMALYPIVLMMGQMVPASTMDTRIGEPIEDAPAIEAGFMLGDKILSIEGNPVNTWEDIVIAIALKKETEIDVEIDRQGETLHIPVTPVDYTGTGLSGIGIHLFEPARVKSVKEDWPASESGIGPGDLVTGIDGELVDWYKMSEILAGRPGEVLELTVKKPDGAEVVVSVVPRAVGSVEDVLVQEDGTVLGVAEDNDRWKKRDKIVAVDGKPVSDQNLETLIGERPGEEVRFTVERTSWFRTELIEIVDTLGTRGMIGMVWDQELTMLKFPPGKAIVEGVIRSVKSVDLVLKTVRGLGAGTVNVKNLSGPIGIARIAAEAWDKGLVTLMQFTAILSFNFFILNLLPLPVLDGGQLVLVGIEAVRRRPVGIKVQIWLQRVGIALLATLMIIVFYNDIANWIKDALF